MGGFVRLRNLSLTAAQIYKISKKFRAEILFKTCTMHYKQDEMNVYMYSKI